MYIYTSIQSRLLFLLGSSRPPEALFAISRNLVQNWLGGVAHNCSSSSPVIDRCVCACTRTPSPSSSRWRPFSLLALRSLGLYLLQPSISARPPSPISGLALVDRCYFSHLPCRISSLRTTSGTCVSPCCATMRIASPRVCRCLTSPCPSPVLPGAQLRAG